MPGKLIQPINLLPKPDQPFPALKEHTVAAMESRFNPPAHETDQARCGRLP
ncbi:hypothetical protein [Cyanobium gracile]|uniref:hypothetical protein n=1 Tax=Cyanobium gracile TaxID=59930 RepID=UPI0002D91F73|nr:hypothetical protein [Cyanobium gracile]